MIYGILRRIIQKSDKRARNKKYGGAVWGTIPPFLEIRKNWMTEWFGSEVESLSDAYSDGNSDSSWIENGHFSHLKVHGYSDKQFFDYNAGGDWARPFK
jgi:hypothetical protein